IPRHQPHLLDVFTGAALAPVDIPNQYAESEIRSDTLLRTPLQTDLDERKELETARLVTQPIPEVTVVWRRFPAQPVFPGDVANFDTSPGQWSPESWQVKQGPQFRVFSVKLQGVAVIQHQFKLQEGTGQIFKMSYSANMESTTDKTTP